MQERIDGPGSGDLSVKADESVVPRGDDYRIEERNVGDSERDCGGPSKGGHATVGASHRKEKGDHGGGGRRPASGEADTRRDSGPTIGRMTGQDEGPPRQPGKRSLTAVNGGGDDKTGRACGESARAPDARIRGRAHTPGREEEDAALGTSGGSKSILDEAPGGVEAHTSPGGTEAGASSASAGRNSGTRAKAASSAAEAYVMEAYLGRHMERVRRKRAAEEVGGGPSTPTAAQRMEAIRRRVAERQAGDRRNRDAISTTGGENAAGACTDSQQSSEDYKMHRDRAAPADHGEPGGGPLAHAPPAAAEHAATFAAWHSSAASPTARRPFV